MGSGQHPNVSTNFDEDEAGPSGFHPTIRILDEEQQNNQNLGVSRFKLRIKFLDPPQLSNQNISAYNKVLSEWLNRAFTALLLTA